MAGNSENTQNKINLKRGDWVHLVAIGGTGMGSLAALLQDLGMQVTGSDGPLYPPMSTFLQSRKIAVKEGYTGENLDGAHWGFAAGAHPKMIVIGNAISRSNLEAQRAEELKAQGQLTIMSFPQALAEFAIAERKSFVVAGTHGKTTTTTIFAWALESLGLKPGFLIGGIPKNFTQGCRVGEGNFFVSEGDEYDTAYWDKESKFLHYRPSWVLCTGIEFDHADIYSGLDAIVKSFEKLVGKTKIGWALIDTKSAPLAEPVERVAAVVKAAGKKLLRYGRAADSNFCLLACEPSALPWRPEVNGTRLVIRHDGYGDGNRIDETFHSPMSGEHNALNALGVFATLVASGELKDGKQFQEMLRGFQGVRRRQDEVAVGPRTVVVDDFAHHPTAIRETILAIRGRYPDAKLAAFFEARSATSARNVFLKEFSECFDAADAVFLSPPSKTNIPEAEKLNTPELMRLLNERPGKKVVVLEKEIDALAQRFSDWRGKLPANQRTVALVMSNGPFGGIHKLLEDK